MGEFSRFNRSIEVQRPTRRWSASLLAERVSAFALHCRQLVRDSQVPERFSSIDLDSLRPDLPQEYRAMAVRLLELLDKPQLIALGGDRGRGKTALACGLVSIFCQLGRPARYARVADLFADLSGTPWEKKDWVRATYTRPDLLVLDEVQVRDANRTWQDNELTTLIDERYAAGNRATLLVSNLKPEELAHELGGNAKRRLDDEGGIFEADWPRIRPDTRSER